MSITRFSFIHTAEDPVNVSQVFHPYLKQVGRARNSLQVCLRYDIQCHDIDEYLVDLVDGLLTERPLEFLEVVTIDGDLPLELFFHISLAKITNWFTNFKDFGQNLSILPKNPCVNPLFYELVEFFMVSILISSAMSIWGFLAL